MGAIFAGAMTLSHGSFSLMEFDYRCWEMDIFVHCEGWGIVEMVLFDIGRIASGLGAWVLAWYGVKALKAGMDAEIESP